MAIAVLDIYKEVSLLLGDVRISTTSDDIPLRYAIDDEYARAVQFVLRAAPWKHATKTSSIADSGSPITGFTKTIAKPSDWRRTLSVFVLSGARECPVHCREQDTKIYTRVTPTIVRFISHDGATESTWPEQFAKAVAAYLAFRIAERDTGNPEKTKEMAAIWQQAFDAARMVDAVGEDPWLTHQLDGSFYAAANMLLDYGYWRSFTKTVALADSSTGTPAPGYSYNFDKPSGWIKLQAFFQRSGVREIPLDFRETDGQFSANYATPTIRYLSSANIDDTTAWPLPFLNVIAAYLGIDADSAAPANNPKQKSAEPEWKTMLAAALAIEAIPENPWLQHQRDGTFHDAATKLLDYGYWRSFLKTVALADTNVGAPAPGYSYNFAKPADWVKTQAFFQRSSVREIPLDFRETNDQFSGNYATPTIRYLSATNLTDPSVWPLPFLNLVAAYLGIWVDPAHDVQADNPKQQPPDQSSWKTMLSAALAIEAIPESPWLQAQRDGSFYRIARSLLEKGFWRFAMKTVSITAGVTTPSSGYGYACAVPADFDRVFHLYRQISSGVGACFEQIDFRYEGGYFHTNYSPIILRYTATAAEDASTWSDAFTAAVLSHIAAEKSSGTGAQMQLAMAAADSALDRARLADDLTERPRVLQVGRLVRARQGGGSGWRNEQAIY